VLLKLVNNYNKKRLCILLNISKLKVVIHYKYTFIMHNLKTNFDKILDITKSFFQDSLNADGNYYYYPNKPKMSDCEIIALSLVGEAIGIDSENYLFGKIKADHIHDFPNLIDRSRFNRRRRRLGDLIARLNDQVSSLLNEDENIYLVDSIPVPICKIAREKRCKICMEDYETAPDKGYSAVTKSYFFGFKLHLAISIRGIYSSMELTKASIHDIHFLNELKYSGIADCGLIGDKGYVSEPIQQDLFTTRQIRLFTPVKSGQHDKEPFPFIFMKSRKRIETLFSQLCDQLMLKRNYAKSTKGLSVRILCKITAVTMLQYINYQNEKPLNHLKYALAS
jgi:hypothetical protein